MDVVMRDVCAMTLQANLVSDERKLPSVAEKTDSLINACNSSLSRGSINSGLKLIRVPVPVVQCETRECLSLTACRLV